MGLIPVPAYTTIKLVGVENLERSGTVKMSMRFYGYRVTDVANRLVCIEVPMSEGVEIMHEAEKLSDFPEIEIEDNRWSYVAAIGKDEARFKKEGGLDGTPPR